MQTEYPLVTLSLLIRFGQCVSELRLPGSGSLVVKRTLMKRFATCLGSENYCLDHRCDSQIAATSGLALSFPSIHSSNTASRARRSMDAPGPWPQHRHSFPLQIAETREQRSGGPATELVSAQKKRPPMPSSGSPPSGLGSSNGLQSKCSRQGGAAPGRSEESVAPSAPKVLASGYAWSAWISSGNAGSGCGKKKLLL